MSTKTIKRVLLSNRVTEEDLIELDACQEGIDIARQLLPAALTPENIAAARKREIDVGWLFKRIRRSAGYGTTLGLGWSDIAGYDDDCGEGDGLGYGYGYGSGDGYGPGYGFGHGHGYGDGYDDVLGYGGGYGDGHGYGYGPAPGSGYGSGYGSGSGYRPHAWRK